MTEQPATSDRQERLRDRRREVEVLLAKTVEGVDAATKATLGTADKLEKSRRSLREAEQAHTRALGELEAAEAQQRQYEGELATVDRRLEMGSIVREARA